MRLLFPSLIHEFEVTGFKKIQDELIDFIYQDNKNDKLGVVKSNRGGWHSRYDLNQDQHFAKNYLNYLGSSLTRELEDIPLFSFVDMWLNLNRKGDYNIMHNHQDCHYALVWFIKTPKIF